MSRIRVTIDELVLKGIAAGDRKALVDGLRSELAKVLADPAARAEWARTHRTPVLRLGQLPLESGVRAEGNSERAWPARLGGG